MVGRSPNPTRLVFVVGLALVFVFTFGALLAITIWADTPATGQVKEVLQLLLTGEGVALALAGAWWFAGRDGSSQ